MPVLKCRTFLYRTVFQWLRLCAVTPAEPSWQLLEAVMHLVTSKWNGLLCVQWLLGTAICSHILFHLYSYCTLLLHSAAAPYRLQLCGVYLTLTFSVSPIGTGLASKECLIINAVQCTVGMWSTILQKENHSHALKCLLLHGVFVYSLYCMVNLTFSTLFTYFAFVKQYFKQ